VLRKLEARGHFESVARMRAIASNVFRYGIATSRCKRDAAADLRGATTSPNKHRSRPAIHDPGEIGALLRAIDAYDRQIWRLALRFLALTFVRPGELRFAEWSEFDLGTATWSIPAEKMKTGLPFLVPLSKQAIEVLRQVPRTGRYVFGGAKRLPDGFNDALQRMGYSTKAEHCAHGFRAMASTALNETHRWDPDVIERQLAHYDPNKVRGAYNKAQYLPQRVEMMQWWADHLDELRSRGQVIRLKRTRSAQS
jgi:integrase